MTEQLNVLRVKNKEVLVNNAETALTAKARTVILEAFEAALTAANPKTIVEEQVDLNRDVLKICEKQIDLKRFRHIFVVGGGKASGSMAEALEAILGNRISKGAINIKEIFDRIRLRGKKNLWLPIAAVTLPLLTIIGNLINFLVGNEIHLFIFKNEPLEALGFWLIGIIPLLFFAGLVSSPLFEEPCWRGFALGMLQGRFGRQIGSLLLGSFWWIWHQPINIANGLEISFYSYLLMVSHSFIIDSLYNLSNKNLLAAMFAHSSLIVTFNFIYSSNNPYILLLFLFGIISLRILEWKEDLKQLADKGKNVMISDQKSEKLRF